MKKLIGDKEVEYKDCIIHRTISQFSFIDRLKILLGKKVTICSHIYTKEDINVITSEANTYIEPIFKKRPKYSGMAHMSGEMNRDNKIDVILK